MSEKIVNSLMEDSVEFKILPLVQADGNDTYDKEAITKITSLGLNGFPPEDRAMAWLVLFKVFPDNPAKWNDVREELRTTYQTYVDALGIGEWHTKSIPQHYDKKNYTLGDRDLIDIVHKDITRTAKHIFMLPPDMLEGEPDDGSNLILYTVHLRRLERILYVIGSINKAMGYMQGFNELLMPIYTVFYSARILFADSFEIEALSFKCLHQLLVQTKIGELFTTQDQSSILLTTIDKFNEVVAKHLPKVHERLQALSITPLLYAFKWIGLLFCQNLEMPVIQELWDCILTHFDCLVEFSFYVGAAQISLVENSIYGHDFSHTLEILQSIRINDVYSVIRIANEWWLQDTNPDMFTKARNAFRSIENPFKNFSMKRAKK